MDEARAVIERLQRIEELRGGDAPADVLLAEVRALVREAEEWSRREGGERAGDAVAKCRDALQR